MKKSTLYLGIGLLLLGSCTKMDTPSVPVELTTEKQSEISAAAPVAAAALASFMPDYFTGRGVTLAQKAGGKYSVTFGSNITFPQATAKILDNNSWENINGQNSPNGNSIDNDLRFFTNGASRGFYWKVPTQVDEIILNDGVTVTGGFWTSGQNLTIRGASGKRWLCAIDGTGQSAWKQGRVAKQGLAFQYTAIKGYGGNLTVKDLTVRRSRAFNINSFDTKIIADNVRILNDRGDPNEAGGNNDGFGGGPGSEIRNSVINVTDDAVKFYRNNQKAINTTIYHNANGAPFQLGWKDEPGATGCQIINCKIVRVSVTGYNQSPIAMTYRESGQPLMTTSVAIISSGNGAIKGLQFENGNYSGLPMRSFYLPPPAPATPNIPLVSAKSGNAANTKNAQINISGKANITGFTSSIASWQVTRGGASISLTN